MEDILAEVITEAVGERCPDFEPDCIGCQAWAEYDRVKGLEAENARMREALQRITTCADWPRGNDVHGIADIARDALGPSPNLNHSVAPWPA